MGHEVSLHESGCRIVPIGVSADWNAPPHRRRMAIATGSAAQAGHAHRSEDAIDAGRTDPKQPDSHRLVQGKMAISFHRSDQKRDQRLQPFAADPVGRLPKHHQCLAHGIVIHAPFGPGPGPDCNILAPQKPFRVLAVIAGDLRELRQDPALFGARCGSIPRPDRLQKFISRSHADPPHAHPQTKLLREHF